MTNDWRPGLVLVVLVLILFGCATDLEPRVAMEVPAQVIVAASFGLSISAADDQGLREVVVDWGDGARQTSPARGRAADLTFTHSYERAGPFIVRVTATDDGGQHATASANVLAVPASVAIIPTEVTITAVGGERALGAAVLDAGGVALVNPEVAWTSLEPGVATVSGIGVVTAVASGTARIVAESWQVADTAAIVVDLEPILRASAEVFGVVGARHSLEVEVEDDRVVNLVEVDWGDGTQEEVVVAARSGKLSMGHTYTYAGPFTVQVTATDGAGLAARASVDLLVRPASVRLAGGDTVNAIGFARRLGITVLDAGGGPVSNPETTWSSLDPSVATVDTEGWVTAATVGTARIAASSWELADTTDVVVRQVPARITFEAPDTLFVRGRGNARAMVRDSNDVAIPHLQPALSTPTPGLLAVEEEGGLVGLAEGTAILVAETTGLSGSTTVELSLGLLYCAHQEQVSSELFVITRHGTLQRNLTQHPAGDCGGAWSPDGDRIVFSSTRTGSGTLLILDTEGGEVSELGTGLAVAYAPAWSPDGQRIAFSGRDHPFIDDVYVIHVDGKGLVALTSDTTLLDLSPAWAPDGSRLAFVRTNGPKPGVYVMNSDGTHPTRVHASGAAPVWSPDGTEIAFLDTGGIRADAVIHRMNADGSNVRVVSEHPVRHFDWSPDGAWFALVTGVGGQQDIFIMSVDGGALIRVTNDPLFEQDVRWR